MTALGGERCAERAAECARGERDAAVGLADEPADRSGTGLPSATATVCAPLRLERAALRARRAGSPLRVVRSGMGPQRAAKFAAARFTAGGSGGPVVVAGIGGGLAPGLRAGDIVVASEVRDDHAPVVPVPSAALLAGELRRLGLRVHVGPVVSSPVVVDGPARLRLAGAGALAVDMESATLAQAASGRPLVVLRSIVDTTEHPLYRPGTLTRGVTGLRALRRAIPALEAWARATGPREVLLAGRDSSGTGEPLVSDAVLTAVARASDLVLVAGPADPAEVSRLVEIAARAGAPMYLVHEPSEVELAALGGVRRIGITAGASTPPRLVRGLLECLGGLGPLAVRAAHTAADISQFTLPREATRAEPVRTTTPLAAPPALHTGTAPAAPAR